MDNNRRGFTLIEILVTIVILGILIIPITRLIIFSVWGTSKTKDIVIAFNLAKDKMERMKILKFDDIINEENDIFSKRELETYPGADDFLKDYQERYLIKYKPFPEKIARFERRVIVDDSVDTLHKKSQLKKVKIVVKKKGSSRVLAELVTLVCNY